MNRRLKKEFQKELQQAFMAPRPTKKESFFRKLNYPKTTWYQFILSQAGYIKIRTWLVSAILMGLILYIVNYMFHYNISSEVNFEVIKICSALMPPLVLNAMTEIVRSKQHGMEELEMTTRYPLANVMLVRMGWMGISNFLVVMCVTVMLAQKTGLFFFRIALYMLIPYVTTILVSLWIINRKPSRDIIYPCGAASILVSSIIWIWGSTAKEWFMQKSLLFWMVLFVILSTLSIHEIRKTIKISEDLKCNSQLTV